MPKEFPMKKFSLLLLALAATIVSSSAFAAPVECKNDDGDKYAVCDAVCNVLPPGAIKCGDCDDQHADINPGINEAADPKLWDDGLNNDCKVSAWETASGDTVSLNVVGGPDVVARFARGLGRSITPKSSSELRLLKDILACKAGNCTVDFTGGKLTPATGYRSVDVDCDGVLNFVPDSYSPTLQDQDKCKKVRPTACPTCPGAPKAKAVRRTPSAAAPLPGSVTPADPAAPAPKASAKAVRGVDYSAPIAKAQATADDAKKVADAASAKVNTFDAALQGHTEQLSAFDTALAEQKTAIANEEARAKAAEAAIDTKAQAAIDRSTEAEAKADQVIATVTELEKQGVLVELSLGGAALLGHDAHVTKNGKVYQMRGNTSPGGYVGLNLGYANETGRFNGFFNLLPLADDGPKGWESSIAYQGGAEVTFKALYGFGVHAMFLQHDAGGSVVGANSYSRGGGAGLSYVSTTSGTNFKVGFQARATVGVESYGAGKGSDTSPFAAFSAGINFGFGPK